MTVKQINFHGVNRHKSYFEGWYLKHQCEDDSIAFIPALHMNEAGIPTCSIQVITPNDSYTVDFPKEDFMVSSSQFFVKMGNNVFSKDGMSVDLHTDKFKINGHIDYNEITPIHSDIMGPFRFFPFMQCNHGVVSLSHNLSGTLNINEKMVNFNGGVGYIETDWGSSFPSDYLWTQCNWQDGGNCSVMLSIANIPISAISFTGCIGTIYYKDKEYRLATYNGARIIEYSKDTAIVKQGRYALIVTALDYKPCSLKAPCQGTMNRTVHESLESKVRYHFLERDKTVFDIVSHKASFETFGL